jgi:hypothetical protein
MTPYPSAADPAYADGVNQRVLDEVDRATVAGVAMIVAGTRVKQGAGI